MADLERNYIIPLRKELLKVPTYRRAKKAINTIRSFLTRHMKVDDVRIGDYLNREIHSRGRKHPPSKVSVKAIKIEEKDNVYVRVDSINAPKEEKKKDLAEKLDPVKEIKEQETKAEKEKVKEEAEKKEVLEHEKVEHKTRGKSKGDHTKPKKLPAKAGIVTKSNKK